MGPLIAPTGAAASERPEQLPRTARAVRLAVSAIVLVLPVLVASAGPGRVLSVLAIEAIAVASALVVHGWRRGRRQLSRLRQLGRDLHGAGEVGDIARVAVVHTASLVRAERVELIVVRPGEDSAAVWTAGRATGQVEVSQCTVPAGVVPEPGSGERLGVVLRLDVEVAGTPPVDVLLHAHPRPHGGAYRAQDLELVAAVADQCAVALRGALLSGQLRHDARHDQLTGLPNRTVFREAIARAVTVAAAGGPPCAVGVLDLDGFKAVNDSLGHQAGDEAIAEVGRRIRARAGDGVTICRLGGDEFGLLLAPVHGPADALAVARRLVAVLEAPVVLADGHVRLGGSVGIASAPADGRDPDTVLRHADLAMYAAKLEGGGIRLYAPELAAAVEAPLTLAADLRLALAQGDVDIAVQPLVDLNTGRLRSVEALARWQHPLLGGLDPEAFVQAADRGGLLGELTAVVLDRALAACRQWRDGGLEVPVAVNLGAQTLADEGLPAVVARALQAHDLPGELLTLELTESGVLDNRGETRDRVLRVIGRLRELGVRLAVDDFGTGYSSLTYLTWLSPDQLKIDKSFVERMRSDVRSAAVVRSIVSLARSLQLEVVAEGIGDLATVRELQAMGCQVAQGYLFARPMPAAALPRWLERFTAASEVGALPGRSPGEPRTGEPRPAETGQQRHAEVIDLREAARDGSGSTDR